MAVASRCNLLKIVDQLTGLFDRQFVECHAVVVMGLLFGIESSAVGNSADRAPL
jgi:hypothetical protein